MKEYDWIADLASESREVLGDLYGNLCVSIAVQLTIWVGLCAVLALGV